MEVHERIGALMNELGIQRAHLATSNPGEVQALIDAEPARFASATLVNPNRMDPVSLARIGERLTIVTGSDGLPASVVDAALGQLTAARLVRFPGYYTAPWSDMVADEPDAIVRALAAQVALVSDVDVVRLSGEGEVAGVSYRIQGQGPPLVLLPLLFAPSQWDPIVDALAGRFTVVCLGGAHLGMIAMLESRGSELGYQRAVRSVFDEIEAIPGEEILEVGCGSGILARWLAEHTHRLNPILATDLNPFFLREAVGLARKDALNDVIRFREANAESLPFEDDSIDISFSSTVMEECDAQRMLAEMVRVTRPGGRVGVIVRATDSNSVCGVDVEPEIKAIIEAPYRSVGERGCADASLYTRFRDSGLAQCSFFPHLLTLCDPTGTAWAYREPYFLAQFTPAQRERWARARDRSAAAGTFVFASGLHCAVGTKPT